MLNKDTLMKHVPKLVTATVVVVGTAVMSTLLIMRHRSNIGRLLSGQESRIRLSKT